MKIHLICRGNVLRSLIAETYLRSLQIPNIEVSSSGTNVDLDSAEERQYFANTISLLETHGIEKYAKDTSHQLTQERTDAQDVTICMNQRVIDEADQFITLPQNTLNWSIVDIGEGHRTAIKNTQQYEGEIFDEIAGKVDELAGQICHLS